MTHRIALVGTGNMGSLHARVLAANERVDLVRRANRADGVGRTSFLMGWLVLSVALATPMAWLVLVLVVWTS